MSSRTLKTLVTVAALLVASLATAAQNTAIKSAGAAVNVTSGIAIAKTKDLNFATIVPGAALGTVTVSTTNVRTFTGPLTFGNGTTSNASFNVTHPGGTFGSTYGLVLPASVTITSGANSMVVDNFTWGYFWVSFFPILVQVDVGATLHVGASQPVGTYSGTFNVTVTEQ